MNSHKNAKLTAGGREEMILRMRDKPAATVAAVFSGVVMLGMLHAPWRGGLYGEKPQGQSPPLLPVLGFQSRIFRKSDREAA